MRNQPCHERITLEVERLRGLSRHGQVEVRLQIRSVIFAQCRLIVEQRIRQEYSSSHIHMTTILNLVALGCFGIQRELRHLHREMASQLMTAATMMAT